MWGGHNDDYVNPASIDKHKHEDLAYKYDVNNHYDSCTDCRNVDLDDPVSNQYNFKRHRNKLNFIGEYNGNVGDTICDKRNLVVLHDNYTDDHKYIH